MNKKPYNIDIFFQNTREELEKKIPDIISDKKIISIFKGGTLIHPILAYLIFKVCAQGKETSSQSQRALEGAISIELAYAASMIHDGIINKEGKTIVDSNDDIADFLLTSHKILTAGFNIALKHGEEVAKLYVDTWDDILTGELKDIDFNRRDLNNLNNISTKSDNIFSEYNQIINQKTASLFSSACKAGALEANMTGDILKVFADYGREIGLAYQLADDLVSLEKDNITDRITFPLINKLRNKKTVNDLTRVITIRKKNAKNSLKIKQLFIKEIKRHVKNAEELGMSEIIPQSQYKDLLREAPSSIINKTLREIKITI